MSVFGCDACDLELSEEYIAWCDEVDLQMQREQYEKEQEGLKCETLEALSL